MQRIYHQENCMGCGLCNQFCPTKIIEISTKRNKNKYRTCRINGIDYQILVEADYIVNTYKKNYSLLNVQNVITGIFKTRTGLSILKSAY